MVHPLDFFGTQTVTINHSAGRNALGVVIENQTPISGVFVENKNRAVITPTGEEAVAASTIYMRNGVEIDLNDTITLPDGTTRRVIAISYHEAPGTPLPQTTQVHVQ